MKKTKKFVIDTNTLISSFILPNSVSRKALNKAIDTGQILFSFSTLDEFSNVFVRAKFDKYLSLDARLETIEDFKSVALVGIPNVKIMECRDPKDNKFLELAISELADCIVTGDQDLLVLHPFLKIPILTAKEFIEQF